MRLIAILLLGVVFLLGGLLLTKDNNVETDIKDSENISDVVNEEDSNLDDDTEIKEPPLTISKKVTLDLSSQGLTKVPEYVFGKTNIELLDLSGNSLDGALQAEIRHLQNLKGLDLSHNNFTGVPAEVGQLTKLITLNLSHNPITGLPHEIGNLKNLEILDLRGTQYSSFDLEQIKQGLDSSVKILVD